MPKLRTLAIAAAVLAAAAAAWLLISPIAGGCILALAILSMVPPAAWRFLSAVFLLVMVIALVSDATPSIYSERPFQSTAFAEHWAQYAPYSLQAFKSSVTEAAGAWAWDGVIGLVIGLPTFVLFGILAALAGYAGRRRHVVEVFVN
jgi:hypothetical protein